MCLVNPLSFNDNWLLLCFNYFLFSYENVSISNISRRGGWTGLGTAKVGCFPLYVFLSHFSPTGPCSTILPKCGANCLACPYINEIKSVTIIGITWKINRNLICKNFNIICGIICNKANCKKTYIGETRRLLKSCLDDHRG